ncbi:MAG: OmpA family protein [Bacteroidales bacterium]|nr:OmpA family protein [Bacteroidales bacterium]
MKKFAAILLCGVILLSSCGASKTAKGGLIGSGAGAAVGAVVGYLITGDAQGLAIGAAVGTAVGGGAGAAIGSAMDKKAEELAALEDAKVETITDKNGLTAIKVTFNSGILFAVNKADLSKEAKEELKQFAAQMADLPDTDITIFGHTDNTGSASVNEKLSLKRAKAVADYLTRHGIAADRIVYEGHSFNEPIASNDTPEGQAQNRRVEIFISAGKAMIEAAEAGQL